MYPLGMLLSLALVVVVFYGHELTYDDDAQTLLIMALGMLVVFMGITIGWRLYLLERDRDGESSR